MVFLVFLLGAYHDNGSVWEQVRNLDRYCLAKTFNVISNASIFTVVGRWWGQAVYLLWYVVKQETSKQHSTVHIDMPKTRGGHFRKSVRKLRTPVFLADLQT